MKAPLLFPALVAFGLVAVGCQDNQVATPPDPHVVSDTSKSPQTITPYRETSFDAVTSQLDPGGSLYGYLAVDQWTAGLSGKIDEWGKMVSELPGLETEKEGLNQGVALVKRLIGASGVESFTGIGISGVQINESLHRAKLILHHAEGQGEGYLWTLFGQEEHELNGLKLLPQSTAVASFGDLNVQEAWSIMHRELVQSEIPQIQTYLEAWPTNFANQTGMAWDEVLGSLSGELGLVLSLDKAKPVEIPVNQFTFKIPAPALMLAVRTSSPLLYDRVAKMLSENPSVITTNVGGLRITILPAPPVVPIPLELVVASNEDYLFVASSSDLVRSVQAVYTGQQPGITGSDDFKELSRYLDLKGNQFTYIDKSLALTLADMQKQAVESGELDPEQAKKIQEVFLQDGPTYGLSVGGHSETGWKTVSVGNRDSAQVMMAAPMVAVAAFSAGMMVPAFTAREAAQTAQGVNQAKQLCVAAILYSEDNDGRLPKAESWCDDLLTYTGNDASVFKIAGDKGPGRSSFAFNSKVSGKRLSEIRSLSNTVLLFQSVGGWNQHGGGELFPPDREGGIIVGFADGSVRKLDTFDFSRVNWDPALENVELERLEPGLSEPDLPEPPAPHPPIEMPSKDEIEIEISPENP